MSQSNQVPSLDEHDNAHSSLENKRTSNNHSNQVATHATLINPRQIEADFARIQAELSNYDDARLIQLGINAQIFERCAFKLRGMIAHELQRRVTQRLRSGGTDNDSSGIIATIIQLAHNLRLEVMTEGVETIEQLEQLRSLGCEYGQGYYFSKLITAESAKQMITA